MRIIDCIQRTKSWELARAGKITASNAERLLTPAKRKTYARDLLVEQLTDQEDSFVSDCMQWGIDNEQNAVTWYEFETNNTVKHVGFVVSDRCDKFGASPDGLIGDNGLIEVKCPSSKVHLDHLESGPPNKYVAQMQWQLFVTGRQWCDFVSYDPRFEEPLQGYIHRVVRDDKYIEKLVEGAMIVLEHVANFKNKMDGAI